MSEFPTIISLSNECYKFWFTIKKHVSPTWKAQGFFKCDELEYKFKGTSISKHNAVPLNLIGTMCLLVSKALRYAS